MTPSSTHIVILPTYNTGPRLVEVVEEVLRHWQPVLVVVDGSTDGSEQPVIALEARCAALTVVRLERNSGKGAAVLAGAHAAKETGFTHALVMDADGQHPSGSIAEFMAASVAHPEAMVLGRPIFPDNIPAERLHGRKLSVGLVRFELLGQAVDDPLFGFRVYPIDPLLAVLGPRGGGRRYDFDTEAAVRLGWSGVPPVNLPAPVRYFSREEGGVSHFHYVRDNATLVWMHTRLIIELLLVRWPALRRHRRRWKAVALIAVAILFCPLVTHAQDDEPVPKTEQRVDTASPAWSDLVQKFARHPDTAADFKELRTFPFRKAPVILKGEVHVSTSHGLSLHYTSPEDRIIILDEEGMLVRDAGGQQAPPDDSRAAAANDAMRNILRFDLAALSEDFDITGARDGDAWQLELVPREKSLRFIVGTIDVEGDADTIRRINLQRTVKQGIEILIDPPKSRADFKEEELKKFFR